MLAGSPPKVLLGLTSLSGPQRQLSPHPLPPHLCPHTGACGRSGLDSSFQAPSGLRGRALGSRESTEKPSRLVQEVACHHTPAPSPGPESSLGSGLCGL